MEADQKTNRIKDCIQEFYQRQAKRNKRRKPKFKKQNKTFILRN